ncbi:hypothetical protein HYV84_04145 [Candidatus Woesearchaeota archaeon]|nr:hypothetical protein [Candidatus Woesearchaeota archaeon]
MAKNKHLFEDDHMQVLQELYRLINLTSRNRRAIYAGDNARAAKALEEGFTHETQGDLEKALESYSRACEMTELFSYLIVDGLGKLKVSQLSNPGGLKAKYGEFVEGVDVAIKTQGLSPSDVRCCSLISDLFCGIAGAVEMDDKEKTAEYLGHIADALPKAQEELNAINQERSRIEKDSGGFRGWIHTTRNPTGESVLKVGLNLSKPYAPVVPDYLETAIKLLKRLG